MTIEYEQGPCGFCPVQAEGKINGLPFHFRSGGGSWSLSIASSPEKDPIDDPDAYYLSVPYDGLHRDEPQEYHGHMVQFGAGYAEPYESKAFIERAAKLLLGE